ncbi:reverse transcriptase domain-containing protein [Methylotuvimicrobium buryatense]|uniref:reverse transcriptase domain-containing protein n=1 Tax=Methylotuvimicrobium buryatense TaxID=95641 RepID=UPI000A0070CF
MCVYADDFVVLCPSEEQAKEALVLVGAFLNTHLELKLCPEKSQVTTFSEGFAFWGLILAQGRSRCAQSP